MTLVEEIEADLAVLPGPLFGRLMNRGFHALVMYRISHRLARAKIPLVPLFLTRIIQVLYSIDLDPLAYIAPGVRIFHGMGTVVGWGAVIGSGSVLYHGVTLGRVRENELEKMPTLGRNVYVYAGAKILGQITIGDGAQIGANAVVTRDVPAGAIAVGIPARIRRPSSEGISPPPDGMRPPSSVTES